MLPQTTTHQHIKRATMHPILRSTEIGRHWAWWSLLSDGCVGAWKHRIRGTAQALRLVGVPGGFGAFRGWVWYPKKLSQVIIVEALFFALEAAEDASQFRLRPPYYAAECLDAIAGYDGIDDRSLGAGQWGSFGFAKSLSADSTSTPRLDGIRVGILKEGFEQSIVQPAVRNVVQAAVRKMEKLGAIVEEVSIPLHLQGPAVWTIQQRISGAAGVLGQAHGRRVLGLTEFEQARLPWTAENFSKLFPSTQNTVINGLYLSEKFPGLYGKAVNIGRQIRDAYEHAFKTFDIIVMPTTPYVAPKHGKRGSPRSCFEPSTGLTTNTAIFNVTGHPAMSLPVGFAPAREDPSVPLPVGMQIVGGLWQEKKVLQAGHAWELNFDWRVLRHDELQNNTETKEHSLNNLGEKRQIVIE
ncbi:hypothetical protein CHU98_g11494 [Xylaria longipes]|nr:hypothetical protein CHU98_g11494 [Xylaria longipes]